MATKNQMVAGRINATAVKNIRFETFRNFMRYNKATQRAIVTNIIDKYGIKYDPNSPNGVWIHIGGGRYIFVCFVPKPPKFDLLGPYVNKLLSKNDFTVKREFTNRLCSSISFVNPKGENLFTIIAINV